MSCWKCDQCNFRNCDMDECQNPKCPTNVKQLKCIACGISPADGKCVPIENKVKLVIPLCQACKPEWFPVYAKEFRYEKS